MPTSPEALVQRIVRLEATIAQQEATIQQLRDELAERDRRIAELEAQLRGRGQRRSQPNAAQQRRTGPDRRQRPHRQHPGAFRTFVPPDEVIHHDVHPDTCPHGGGHDLHPTGQFEDHYTQDIPEPKFETHRWRRHVHLCAGCHRTCQGRGELELPDAHLGPRARLLVCYARAHLGLALGKTCDLLEQFWGLRLSRAGALGHLRWGLELFSPVVGRLWELLRESELVHGDETSWRINGDNVWLWCFANARLALYLVDQHRNRAVLLRALGEDFAGVLVSDFYAVYDGLDCDKQRCLVHLLRELARLREKLSDYLVKQFTGPLIELFQDAMALGKRRGQLSAEAFAAERSRLWQRLDDLVWARVPRQADCVRIRERLIKYWDELFTFLYAEGVPPDNNAVERDIRSVAAVRADGGTNRTQWGADAFACIKSVVRTCAKAGKSFLRYGLEVVRARLRGAPEPLPVGSG
jgi:transposase